MASSKWQRKGVESLRHEIVDGPVELGASGHHAVWEVIDANAQQLGDPPYLSDPGPTERFERVAGLRHEVGVPLKSPPALAGAADPLALRWHVQAVRECAHFLLEHQPLAALGLGH